MAARWWRGAERVESLGRGVGVAGQELSESTALPLSPPPRIPPPPEARTAVAVAVGGARRGRCDNGALRGVERGGGGKGGVGQGRSERASETGGGERERLIYMHTVFAYKGCI